MEPFGMVSDKEGIDAGYALADALMAQQTAQAPLSVLSQEAQSDFFAHYEQLVLRGAGYEVDLQTASAVWLTVRKQECGFALYDDVLPVLNNLRSQGFVIGVVTNMSRPGDDVASSTGFRGSVDFTLSSMDVGASKPDPKMFQAALSQAGVPPEQAVHVGDQIETDIDGAKGVGINPVLIDRHSATVGYEQCPRITTMTELPDVLEGFNLSRL